MSDRAIAVDSSKTRGLHHTPRNRSFWAQAIARGYSPPSVTPPTPEVIASNLEHLPNARRVVWIFPTTYNRSLQDTYEEYVDNLLRQMGEMEEDSAVAVIALQYQDSTHVAPATEKARALALRLKEAGIFHCIFLMKAKRKLSSLNGAIALTRYLKPQAWGWVDDDVALSPKALRILTDDALRDDFEGAVGAFKVGTPEDCPSSRLLYALKAVTQPAVDYPHGCCIVVDSKTIGDGLPWRYYSEDGYLCFSLLRPHLENPLQLLRIERSAVCNYKIGTNDWRSNVKRLRRLLLNHNILLADSSSDVAQFYLKRLLFHGMWPYSSLPPNLAIKTALAKASVKWIWYLLYTAVKAELIVRGIVGRPLTTVTWGTAA